jgi:AcrR family transcriptional regulator
MKEPEVRKSEILDAAQKLFAEKGYAKATVTDIINVHGLSKGIFYHYFKSKEEVMDAIIERIVDQGVAKAKLIATHPGMTNQQKLFTILIGQGMSEEATNDKENVIEQLHEPENAEMHHKSLALTVKRLAPVIAELINNGEEFSTDYPLETVEFLIAGGQFVFDKGVFQWSEEETVRRAMAFIGMLERALGTPKGYFEDIKKILT